MTVRGNLGLVRGNLAEDPKVLRDREGKNVTALKVIENQRRYDREAGQWVEGDVENYSVYVRGAEGGNAASSLREGDPVVFSGDMTTTARVKGEKVYLNHNVNADFVAPDLRRSSVEVTRTGRAQSAQSAPTAFDEAAAAAGWSEPAAEDPWRGASI